MSSRTSIRSRISRIEILELIVVYTFHMAKTCTFERPMYPKTHTYASNSFLSVMLSSQSLPCNLQRFPSCCQKVLLPPVETSYGSSRAARKTIFLLAIFKHNSCNCEPVRKCVLQDWKFMKFSADCVVIRPALTVFNTNGCFDRTASEGRKPCKRRVGSQNQDQVMQVQH